MAFASRFWICPQFFLRKSRTVAFIQKNNAQSFSLFAVQLADGWCKKTAAAS